MDTVPAGGFPALLDFLQRLDDARIWHMLTHVRDSVMILTAVPGERWEIEFFADGRVEVERFRSSGVIEGAETLERLFEALTDDGDDDAALD